VIYGVAVNEKVMAIYLEQFEEYGFRGVGKLRIEWRSGQVPVASIA
jgi:hypothetical protein